MSDARLATLTRAATAAYVYTLPLMEMAAPRTRALGGVGRANVFAHVGDLVDHTARAATTPNNDTLYSSAQLDLSAGPVTIALPAAGARYLSLALMDAWSNNFAVLGTRTTGGGGGTFTLVGPSDAAEGPAVLRSPTRHVWALARILVDGEPDLPAARAVQQAISVQGPDLPLTRATATREAPWPDYFAGAAALMALDALPVTDRARLELMAPLRLNAFDPAAFSFAEAQAIEAGLSQAREALRRAALQGVVRPIEGWIYPHPHLGDYGQDYRLRATAALVGLGALPPQEAIYLRAQGDLEDGLFDGERAWRLGFPAHRLPPVDGFWSLSLYEATPAANLFSSDNPIGRYAIGDRTEGLRRNADGSLDLWIGHERPGGARDANWLPAPAGPFALMMRAYLPHAELLTGAYRLPPVERLQD